MCEAMMGTVHCGQRCALVRCCASNLTRDPQPFDAILADAKHEPIFPDLVNNRNPQYLAGGSTQNSIRVAQWLLQKPVSVAGALKAVRWLTDDDMCVCDAALDHLHWQCGR